MVQVNRNVAPSFNTIIEILQNDQRKIKLIRKYENTRKKIINNECAILFNKTCINESLLPKYIYIYIDVRILLWLHFSLFVGSLLLKACFMFFFLYSLSSAMAGVCYGACTFATKKIYIYIYIYKLRD